MTCAFRSIILGDQPDQLETTSDQHTFALQPSPPPVARASNFSADSVSKVTVLSASDSYADRDLPPTPSVYSPDRTHFANSFLQRNSSLSRSRPGSPRSASILNLDKKAVVKSRISQWEPHRADDVQSNRSRDRPRSDLRRRGSTHSTGSDSLLELYSVQSVTSGTEPYTRSALPAPSLDLIPEVASVSQISEPQISSMPPSLNDPVPSVDTDGRLAPLVELLQDQATKHYYHTNDLKDQIASLNSEMHTMFQELKVVIGEQPAPDVNMSKLEEALDKSFATLETTVGNLQSKDDGTVDLKRELDVIRDEIKSLDIRGGPSTPSNADTNHIGDAVLEKLETLRMEVKNRERFPDEIVTEIAKLREALDLLPVEGIKALNDVDRSQKTTTGEPASVPAVDLSEVHAKLDEFIQGFKSQLTKEPTTPKIEIPEVRFADLECPDPVALTPLQLQDIMNILVETRDQQATQNDRQADSARYLNELNSVRRPVPFEDFSLWTLNDRTTRVVVARQVCKGWNVQDRYRSRCVDPTLQRRLSRLRSIREPNRDVVHWPSDASRREQSERFDDPCASSISKHLVRSHQRKVTQRGNERYLQWVPPLRDSSGSLTADRKLL